MREEIKALALQAAIAEVESVSARDQKHYGEGEMTTRDDGPEPVGEVRAGVHWNQGPPPDGAKLYCIYLEPPQPKKAEPQGGEIVGWVEEDALPLTGRTTLHSEPNASRVALVRHPLQGEETP